MTRPTLDPRSWALPVAVDWRREFVVIQVLCLSWSWDREPDRIPGHVALAAAVLARQAEIRSEAERD